MTRIALLRHGATDSHRGDMPLTARGRVQAERAGRVLGEQSLGRCLLLTSPILRARQTALLLAHGISSADPEASLSGPVVTWGLRNPDLYLSGERVDMVSSAEAFSEQVSSVTAEGVEAVGFFRGFLATDDRIGYWLHHPGPPGESAADVARRVMEFAVSLTDGARPIDTALCVTHSPVQRAVALDLFGEDPGEPQHLAAIGFTVADDDRRVTGAHYLTATASP